MHRATILLASVFGAALTLGACAPLPADPRGTTQNVERRGSVQAGLIAGEPPAQRQRMETLAANIASRHHVRLDVRRASAETLMSALDRGELDVVVGVFPKKSPWSRRVALTAPFPKVEVPKDQPVVRAAVHRGENRWLLSLEKTIEMASP